MNHPAIKTMTDLELAAALEEHADDREMGSGEVDARCDALREAARRLRSRQAMFDRMHELEAALLLYGGHAGSCSGPGCDCGWYEVGQHLPRLTVAERDRRLAKRYEP